MRLHWSFPRGNPAGAFIGWVAERRYVLEPSACGIPSRHSSAGRSLSPAAGRCLLGCHGRLVARSGLATGRSGTGHSPERTHLESRGRHPSEGEARPDEIVRLKGLPVTSAFRTTVDLGSNRVLVGAVIALDMALHRRIVDLTDLRTVCEANRGAKRVAKLRRAVELAEPATESPMETRLRMLLVTARLPRPQAQVPLHDLAGRFLGRPDLYHASHKLGLEYDGGTHRDNLVEDNRRQNRLLNGGIRLLRFTAPDIFRTPASGIAQG